MYIKDIIKKFLNLIFDYKNICYTYVMLKI